MNQLARRAGDTRQLLPRRSLLRVKGWLQDQILEHLAYARENGIVDKSEIQDLKWTP